MAVLDEQRGTCSSKHALLKRAADENGRSEVELIIGIFRLNAHNTPKVGAVLARHGLAYLPEAHCYLRYQGRLLDATLPNTSLAFADELLAETLIEPAQATDYKVKYHQQFLTEWLLREQHPLTLMELWAVREACILTLSA